MLLRPNLFDFATSELSQDAFIAWLLSYANPEYATDKLLHQCGQHFVKALIQKQLPEFDEDIKQVEVKVQYNHIDVFAVINEKYIIVLEDKIHASQHSEQLSLYKEFAEEFCKKNSIEQIICIYLKTGAQSQTSLREVLNDGFDVFNRQEFLSVLRPYAETENPIFHDYLALLEQREESYQRFEKTLIKEWQDEDWIGFYQVLETRLWDKINHINWGYAANPMGGFQYFCFNWLNYLKIHDVYLQIESNKKDLCFKVWVSDNEKNRSDVRNQLYELVIHKAEQHNLPIQKPVRFGSGKTMTFAVVKAEDWLGNLDQTVNLEQVIKNLLKYADFMQRLFPEN